jgi:MFS family permease
MFLGMAAAQGMWAVASGPWSLAAFALAYGTVYGGWVALLPALVADYFGGRNVSGIIGILYTSVAFGNLVGPTTAGYMFDISHSYTPPIVASVCASVIAAAMMAATSGECSSKS